MRARNLNGILVTTDNPEYMETDIRPESDVFSLSNLDVKDLRSAYREKQRNFTTVPIDVLGERLRFYPGNVTIWSGHPGAGKTTLLRQLTCKLLHANLPTFVCSLEEKPVDVFLRHCCCALGTTNPSEDGLQWCADTWLDTLKIWNYSARDSDAEHAKILAAIRVLARDHGVRHAVIDSLFCLDVPVNDLEAQRRFSRKLMQTCQLSGVHIHLVAHPRKKTRADQEDTLDDVAGSADLSRAVDNILFVKRAKNENAVSSPDVTPMLVSALKQREHPGWIGDVVGWYNRNMHQFVFDQFQAEPTRYLCADAYKYRVATDSLF